MATSVNLLTTPEQLRECEALADGRKHIVRVDREALDRLLIDYGVMRNAILSHKGTFTLTEPTAQPRRQRTPLRV